MTRRTTARGTRSILLLALLGCSVQAVAGWFGYDTREECMSAEPGKLMSRWVNPLPKRQAMQAAEEVCKAYPNKYEFRVRSMSTSELVEERKRAVVREAEQDRYNARVMKTGAPLDLRPRWTHYIDAELERRK